MLWVPRKMPTGKGHLFLKSLSTVQSMEANSDTHVPAGTGPAPIWADTSTVNAFRLKSYFSKELCVLVPVPRAEASSSGICSQFCPESAPTQCCRIPQHGSAQGLSCHSSSLYPPAADLDSPSFGKWQGSPLPLCGCIHSPPASSLSKQSQV